MLSVSDLSVSIGTRTDFTDIVSSVSFEIGKGEILGLVGESGCGKSMTSLAVMGLLPEGGPWVRTGRAELAGFDVIHSPPYRRVETGHGCIAMIFQEPMSSLNPVMKIGEQIEEAIRVHEKLSGDALTRKARELLELVRIPDEPTTALDVTVQTQILSLLRELCDSLGLAILFITHDLGVVAQLVDRVAVMYAGRIVETAAVAQMFERPAHPYTEALMSCLPDPARFSRRLTTIP